MDEKAIKAVRQGISRGLSQYFPPEGETPVELRLLLQCLQNAEEKSEAQLSAGRIESLADTAKRDE